MSVRPKGAGAVMAAHAPASVEADTALQALHRKLNYFPTPPWAARAGGELIQRLDPGPWTCWEPACGQGHMAFGLSDYFPEGVWASDIHDHGFGSVIDFLGQGRLWPSYEQPDWIVTNPPFDKAAEFVEAGLRRARRGVAVLCRQGWFESEGRERLFFGDRPLSVYASFFDRLSMKLGRWEPGAGGNATAYAWFVWFRAECEPEWIGRTRSHARALGLPGFLGTAIPFGTKARLTRRDDARLFGAKGAAPLLGEG